MLAAWLPGRRAAKIPPVAAMSSVHAQATTKSLVVRNTLGALFAAAGVAVVLYATTMSGSDGQAPMGLGAVLLIIGVFVLTPLLSRPDRGRGPGAPCLGLRQAGPPGTTVRNPRRTAATASALMIGLTLITGMTVMAGSLQKSIDKMASSAIKADYVVSMAENGVPLSPQVAKTLAGLDGVTDTSPLRTSPSRIDGTSEMLAGVNGESIAKLTDLTLDEGAFKVGGTQVVVDDDTAKSHGWKAGSDLTVSYEDGKKQRLTVAGIYHGNMMINGIMVDNATLSPHLTDIADMQVMLKTADGTSDATKNKLEKALGDNQAVQVQDKKDISNNIAQMFTLLLNMLYGLLAMAVVVAVLGVINTLAMSVFERSQEIGMLRAIGLDRKGIKRMVQAWSPWSSRSSAACSASAWACSSVGRPASSSAARCRRGLVLPWDRMALFLLLAGTVGVLASAVAGPPASA